MATRTKHQDAIQLFCRACTRHHGADDPFDLAFAEGVRRGLANKGPVNKRLANKRPAKD